MEELGESGTAPSVNGGGRRTALNPLLTFDPSRPVAGRRRVGRSRRGVDRVWTGLRLPEVTVQEKQESQRFKSLLLLGESVTGLRATKPPLRVLDGEHGLAAADLADAASRPLPAGIPRGARPEPARSSISATIRRSPPRSPCSRSAASASMRRSSSPTSSSSRMRSVRTSVSSRTKGPGWSLSPRRRDRGAWPASCLWGVSRPCSRRWSGSRAPSPRDGPARLLRRAVDRGELHDRRQGHARSGAGARRRLSRPSFMTALIDRLVEASTAYLTAQIDAGADAVQIFESLAGGFRRPVRPLVARADRPHRARPQGGAAEGRVIVFVRGGGPNLAPARRGRFCRLRRPRLDARSRGRCCPVCRDASPRKATSTARPRRRRRGAGARHRRDSSACADARTSSISATASCRKPRSRMSSACCRVRSVRCQGLLPPHPSQSPRRSSMISRLSLWGISFWLCRPLDPPAYVTMLYDWLKAFHVIAVIAWMAGMLYLPRLFVYHAESAKGSIQSETFKIMERRLLKAIINPAMRRLGPRPGPRSGRAAGGRPGGCTARSCSSSSCPVCTACMCAACGNSRRTATRVRRATTASSTRCRRC